MKKLLLVLLLLVFGCQPVVAAHLPDASGVTGITAPDYPDTHPFKWVQTATLVNGLYMLLYRIPESSPYYIEDQPYSIDAFYIYSTEGSMAIVDLFNEAPLTKPDQIGGFFYFDQDTWVTRNLPCRFGEERRKD